MRIPAAAAGLMAGLAAWCGLDGGTTTDGVVFTDVTEQAGIRFRHTNGASGQKYLVETMGPGCAFVDYDADGYLDIFLVNGGLLPGFGSKGPIANALYRNNRDGTFTDVTGKAGVAGGGGYGMGVAAADYDNDGLADLFVSGFRSSLLYHNHGDGTFREVGERAGIRRQEWGTSAAFFDYDRDGWLDLYVANYMDYRLEQNPYCGVPGKYRSYCHPDEFRGAAGTLYRNQGDGTFRDASAASGIGAHVGKGLGAVAADFNQDGFPDLYIANDAVANFLFLNNGDGTFTETGALAGAAYSGDGKAQSGMGAAAGDFNQDGRPDILVTNLSNEGHTLYRNDGNGYFSDVTFPAGVGKPSLLLTGWGTGFADYDNDGDEDIVAAHGHVMDNVELVNPTLRHLQPMLLLENTGGRFADSTARHGAALAARRAARGLALGDYDNDGDVDLLVAASNGMTSLLRNDGGNRGRWLMVEPRGRESNRYGIGLKARVTAGGSTQVKEIPGGASYLSSGDRRLHFGLGASARVDRLEIAWPRGKVQVLENVRADQILRVQEP